MISQKTYILLSFFCLSTLSIHAMHKLELTINSLHENNKSRLSKTQQIQQRQNATRDKAYARHISAKDKTIKRKEERQKKYNISC